MNKRQDEGAAREDAGRALKEKGRARGDPELEAEGLGEEVAGKIEKAEGDLEELRKKH